MKPKVTVAHFFSFRLFNNRCCYPFFLACLLFISWIIIFKKNAIFSVVLFYNIFLSGFARPANGLVIHEQILYYMTWMCFVYEISLSTIFFFCVASSFHSFVLCSHIKLYWITLYTSIRLNAKKMYFFDMSHHIAVDAAALTCTRWLLSYGICFWYHCRRSRRRKKMTFFGSSIWFHLAISYSQKNEASTWKTKATKMNRRSHAEILMYYYQILLLG